MILNGTLIESDRLVSVRENCNDLWFSQKHARLSASHLRRAPPGTRTCGYGIETHAGPRIRPWPGGVCPRRNTVDSGPGTPLRRGVGTAIGWGS